MADLILKKESYLIVGICMEVHREMGMGFKEVLYKDAIELVLKSKNIVYKKGNTNYTNLINGRSYFKRRVVFNSWYLYGSSS